MYYYRVIDKLDVSVDKDNLSLCVLHHHIIDIHNLLNVMEAMDLKHERVASLAKCQQCLSNIILLIGCRVISVLHDWDMYIFLTSQYIGPTFESRLPNKSSRGLLP